MTAANKLVGTLVLVVCAGAISAAVGTGVRWTTLRTAEKSGDDGLESVFDKNSLLGGTRAVYLPGYGVVFSAEMDVAPGSTPNPFRPAFTREEIAKIKETKRQRLIALRERMQRLMVTFSDSVQVSDGENIAMAVTIYYSKIEDQESMPKQIVMWAPRGSLRSGNPQAIAATLKIQESF